MRNKPAFAATAVVTLALAIGANTAMFTVIRAVLLKPLQYRDPESLVRMSGGATPARFAEMKLESRSMASLGAFAGAENLTLSGGPEPEVLNAARVSANFLEILGVAPVRGRGFRPEEDSPGGAPVAIVSSELWRRAFSEDPHIAGRTVALGSQPYTVVGVLPPRFEFPFAGVDVWLPAPSESPLFPPASRELSPFLTLFGRLKRGATLQQANAEMRVVRLQYAMAHPARLDAKAKTPVEVTPMKDELVAKVRSMLLTLFGAVTFVLLIACANVASLLLARAASRSREFAIRSALGAARARLVGQLLAESVLLSCLGGALGVLAAAWILRAISAMTSFPLPRAGEIHLDWAILGFAAALSVSTGILFGLAPALGASRPDLIRVLRATGAIVPHGRPGGLLDGVTLRRLLLVAQVALSIMLLIGAALLVQSVSRMRGVDVGFNPSNLLTMQISLPPLRYGTDQKKVSFFQEILRRVESLHGVRGATAAMFLPMMGFAGTPVQDASKPPLPLNERPIATILIVTPGNFRTLEIPLRRGRDFTERDTPGAQRVAIVDEALVRRFWPAYPSGIDPVGQMLLIGGVKPKPAQIVGIAAGVHQSVERTEWPESVYVAFAQNPPPFASLAIRTAGTPLGFTRAVRETVRTLDHDQPIAAVRTMEDLVEEQVGPRRLLAILLGSFAGVALLLALIGVYGIIAYSVEQRTQEVGIRRALGARQGDILWLVLGEGLRLALAGIAVGVAGAFILTRLMRNLLFHVGAADPTTFAAVAILFLAVALAASYIPARRAARIDPMTALRIF